MGMTLIFLSSFVKVRMMCWVYLSSVIDSRIALCNLTSLARSAIWAKLSLNIYFLWAVKALRRSLLILTSDLNRVFYRLRAPNPSSYSLRSAIQKSLSSAFEATFS